MPNYVEGLLNFDGSDGLKNLSGFLSTSVALNTEAKKVIAYFLNPPPYPIFIFLKFPSELLQHCFFFRDNLKGVHVPNK